ncbi:MAG: bifunctional oligoribonuclease/PAP phosphatase NrnA [bacterium]
MSLKRAAECIRRNNSFVITAHTSVEGDALGSELALYKLLKRLGKQAVIINEDALPAEYAFLPGVKKIKRFNNTTKAIKFDCFALLDCSDLSRCGKVSGIDFQNRTVLNIDHHVSNSRFGDVNWVDPLASSASEMVYRLFGEMRIPLDKETAELLYVGILTDTGSFHYSNTTGNTHKAAAELLKYGIDVAGIYKEAYSNVPFSQMKRLGKALSDIRRDSSGKVAWALLKDDSRGLEAKAFDLSEYLLSSMRSIKGVEVAVLFREGLPGKGKVRVNLRSQGLVDVNKVAGCFFGGGHRTASGCTIAAKNKVAVSRVLSKIKERL